MLHNFSPEIIDFLLTSCRVYVDVCIHVFLCVYVCVCVSASMIRICDALH